jgi:hypothetical protein
MAGPDDDKRTSVTGIRPARFGGDRAGHVRVMAGFGGWAYHPAMLAVSVGRLRMGWLLRVNRVLGPQRDLVTAARFACALRSLGGGAASPAQVSKWETGAARVGHGTVRRYERLLGLPVNRLAAMAAILPDTAVTHTGGDPAALPDLLDAGLSGDPMTGPGWDDLTAQLQDRHDVLIHPRDSWERLTHRLLTEMVVADGLPWIQRNAALARLLRHPSGGAAAIAACASFAADPAHQVFVEPLAALHVTPHPDATRRVLAGAQQRPVLGGRAAAAPGRLAAHRLGHDAHHAPPPGPGTGRSRRPGRRGTDGACRRARAPGRSRRRFSGSGGDPVERRVVGHGRSGRPHRSGELTYCQRWAMSSTMRLCVPGPASTNTRNGRFARTPTANVL